MHGARREQGGFRVVQTKVGTVRAGSQFGNGDDTRMAELTGYAASPFAFIFHYIRLRPISHAAILTAVLAAVGCAVCTQYGVKFLVDTLSSGENAAAWTAFFLLGALIAADNLLWRVAAWIANYAFVGVTGDLRRDLVSSPPCSLSRASPSSPRWRCSGRAGSRRAPRTTTRAAATAIA